MSRWLKFIIGFVSVFIIVLIAGLFIFSRVLYQSLPDYEDEKDFSDINERVEIYRDKYAVPYIISQNEIDAAFALGYVQAQDRMFQMDLFRRAGSGRLSEVMGRRTLSFDIMFKTIGLDSIVIKAVNELDPEIKNVLDAYSKGVNAYIEEFKGNYPFEFDVLNYDPEPWRPEHSLLVGKLLAWELNISWWTDIVFADLVQKFGKAATLEILPDYPENAPYIIPNNLSAAMNLNKEFIEVDRSFRDFMGIAGTHLGSNNWVVNNEMSISNKPIMANDPHLALGIPAKWYIAVIKSDNWNCAGLTIPGTPAIIIGNNESISWSVTNVMADDTDFYIEKLDSLKDNYFVDGEWKPLIKKEISIAVKDTQDVVLEIISTHRGPIISNIHPYNTMYEGEHNDNRLPLSMRWIGNEFHDEYKGLYKINRAQTWGDFKSALKYFSAPGQNFVYADKDDNIGYICAAKIPVRKNNSPTFIFDGTDSKNDWQEFVPYDEMPSLFNPPQNFIATANNKVDKNFKYHISNLWEPSSRIERITELLTNKSKHSTKNFEKYQMDFISPYAKEVTEYLLNAFKGVKIKDENLKTTITLFENWNYEFTEYSQVPSIYAVFYQYLLKNIFEDEMGEALFSEYKFMANVPYRTILKLMKENISLWFDDIKTKPLENRDIILRKSLVDALDHLEKEYGKDAKNWQWNKLHSLTLKHPFDGESGLLNKFINIGPYNIGGDGTTIFNTEYSLNKPFDVVLGPSMRYIYDFAEPENFYVILPTGQSGNVLSDNYKDMTENWLLGRNIKINTNIKKIKNSNYKLTILK